MKKGSLSMGVKALIYVTIAIILIFGVSDLASQLFKSIFGLGGQCVTTDYIVDELPEIVDSIKAGEIDYGVRILNIKKGCSLISFDSDQDPGEKRPFMCEGKTCLCVCSTDSFWLGRIPNCEEHFHCYVFEDEKAIREEAFFDSSGMPDYNLGKPIEIFSNVKTPYYINYHEGMIYLSTDNVFNDLGKGISEDEAARKFIEGQSPEFIEVNFRANGISEEEIEIAKNDPSKRIEILLNNNVDPALLMGGFIDNIYYLDTPVDSLAILNPDTNEIFIGEEDIKPNNPQSWPKSEFFKAGSPLTNPSLSLRTSHYVTAYSGDYNLWTTTNNASLGSLSACKIFDKGFFEAVKCQGSGIDENFISYTYQCIKSDGPGCSSPPTDILGNTASGKGPRVFKTIAVNSDEGSECYIPLGSYVYIDPGEDKKNWAGWYLAEDKGSFSIMNKCQIDVYAGLGEIGPNLSTPDNSTAEIWVYDPNSNQQITYDENNLMETV